MKGRKTWQLGYAAGLIDGEGCITIGRHHKTIRGNNFIEYRLEVIVNQTDGGAIDFMYGTFGGYIHKRNSKPNPNYRPFLYRWEIRGEKAMKFLKRIIPFLKIKKQQAELAIQFQSIRTRNPKNQYTGKFDVARYAELHQRMSDLKKVWLPSAAAETKWNDAKNISEAIVHTSEN